MQRYYEKVCAYMDYAHWDKSHIWHPFTQHQGARPAPLVTRAQGATLFLADGRTLIDGISSWWVNLHGHCHPYIVEALAAQAHKLEQVIFADFTHEEALGFTQALVPLLPPGLSRVFFSDNGSTAVEVALKMAIQYWYNLGTPKRKFVVLRGGYHGDTFGAMAVSARSPFSAAFAPLFFEVLAIDPPLRNADHRLALAQLDEHLNQHDDIAGFIYEPLVQGTAGMMMQDPHGLDLLLTRARQAGILCIADEVMTGFGRTGALFASSAMEEQPDIICLGKGLTAGMLPLSVTAAREFVFAAFLGASKERAFLHGHSFTANSLGCRVALASLELLLAESCRLARRSIEAAHQQFRAELLASPEGEFCSDVRVQGTILAVEIRTPEGTGYFNGLGETMAEFFVDGGVLLRPLGNIVYILPPYCITAAELGKAHGLIRQFLRGYFP